MTEKVAYSQYIVCTSCGMHYAGYLEIAEQGKGMATCPRCGAAITQALPSHYVVQLAPSDYESPAHPHVHISHYPGLYMQPKRPPRFDLRDLLRVMYSPSKAFPSLYLSTNLQRSLAIVVLFSVVSSLASILVTLDAGSVLNFDTRNALEVSARGAVSWLITLFGFLVFGVVGAVLSRGVFGGRGERTSTLTLLGYCFPAYVVLSIILLSIFNVGLRGLDILNMSAWTDAQLEQAMVTGVLLFGVLIIGLIWLVWVVARAFSVANDVSMGEGVLTTILAAIPSAIVFLVVGAVMRLPVGLSL